MDKLLLNNFLPSVVAKSVIVLKGYLPEQGTTRDAPA